MLQLFDHKIIGIISEHIKHPECTTHVSSRCYIYIYTSNIFQITNYQIYIERRLINYWLKPKDGQD